MPTRWSGAIVTRPRADALGLWCRRVTARTCPDPVAWWLNETLTLSRHVATTPQCRGVGFWQAAHENTRYHRR